MSLLRCSHCHEPISATYKQCPHCGRKISFLSDLKSQVEGNRLWQVSIVVLGLLLLGVAWFWRMDTGDRWPLYVLILVIAPLVPWLLKLAYKNAAPLASEESERSTSKDHTDNEDNKGHKE